MRAQAALEIVKAAYPGRERDLAELFDVGPDDLRRALLAGLARYGRADDVPLLGDLERAARAAGLGGEWYEASAYVAERASDG